MMTSKLGCDDFICTYCHKLLFNAIRLTCNNYTVTQEQDSD